VFDAHDPESIAEVALAAGLTAVQLHGGFDEELLQRLGRRLAGGIRIIQTLHWPVGQESAAARIGGQVERILGLGITGRVLIDSRVGVAGGGTGVAFDWTAAREVFTSATNGVQLILAGGLGPDNVSQAIGQLGPWGVDVSSGVEAAPGRKDPERLRHFIENARAAANP
jgi:phosphoribosylanthranilate isomerase